MRRDTLAAANMMDPLAWSRQHLADLDPDLVRSTLASVAEELMSAEASAACNASSGERTPADEQQQPLSGSRVGRTGRHDRSPDPEVADR
jgi:hypothetical protein